MDKIQKLFFEMKFELFFYKERGNGFEDLFSKIMKKKYKTDFKEVKTWGDKGDMKCDGYQTSTNTLFQCYAPNQISGTKLLNKFKEDYTIASEKWEPVIKKWIFVQNSNDGVKGIEAPTLNAILRYKVESGIDLEIDIWGIDEVKDIVLSLEIQDIEDLLGPLPTIDEYMKLEIRHIEPVLDKFRLLHSVDLPSDDFRQVPPDKIEVNNFSEHIQELLKIGMKKAHLIDKIIENSYDVELFQNLSDSFQKEYTRLRVIYPEDSDIIYIKLRTFGGVNSIKNSIDDLAILTILAFLFESCSIFERSSSNV